MFLREMIYDECKSKLTERFDRFDNIGETDELWKAFKEELVSVALACEVCGVSKGNKKKKIKTIWWDKEVQKAER